LKVVSDTSTLIAFTFLGKVDILNNLFGRLMIPDAVHEELYRKTRHPLEDWIDVTGIENKERYHEYREYLGHGESEAICLYLESHADLILLDDGKARRVAKRLLLRRTGVLGILLRAKVRGLIGEIGPEIEKLQNELEFRISEQLKDDILRKAGEW
jgi:predicted nucleic acid-binding protein